MTLDHASRRWVLLSLGLAGVLGCSYSEPPSQTPWGIDTSALVPVKGVVTLNGKPLAHAVVAFMGSSGVPGVAETEEDGRYTLETTSVPGAMPGDYKVSISYLVSPEGEPQGLGERSAMVQSPAMREAVEQLPPEYSDLNRTKLVAHVGSKGGWAFNYDVPVSIKLPTEKVGDKDGVATKSEGDAGETKPAGKDVDKAGTPEKK